MRLLTTIYASRELDFSMVIQPKPRRDANGAWIDQESMFTPYQSKIGNMSLIFNPSISLRIRSNQRDIRSDGCTIPANLIYLFSASLNQVYNNALAKGTYKEDEGLFLDPKVMATAARRLSLFKGAVIPVVAYPFET